MREIPYYQDYVSDEFLNYLQKQSHPVDGIKDLAEIGTGGGLESREALEFLCVLYDTLKEPLNEALSQRRKDREFIDSRTKLSYALNKSLKIDYLDPLYQSVIGQKDTKGRVVVGPLNEFYAKRGNSQPIAKLPDYLVGYHVTLFGPPDDAKLSINAMNGFHRRLKNEPKIVEQLLEKTLETPKWGADDEDSKTPLREDLIKAGQNLTNCFDRSIGFVDQNSKKEYKLESKNLSLPIKRFPGLALPCLFLLYRNNPLPLHLYDFALHFFKNWHNHEALSFYVPKLETPEEAAYIHLMVATAEKMIQQIHGKYKLGTVRLFVVLENPRLIFRVNEMMDELYPYFAGASLGWHDYLASTARLFKEDANYRIPVKADPNIVVKYIKASHQLLAEVVGSRGGVKIGGMYGILPIDSDLTSESFQLTIRGYIKDVVTQLKRDLSGFWVAHPDFIRLGLALVEAWKFHIKGDPTKLEDLVKALLDQKYHLEILNLIRNVDPIGLATDGPFYARSLIVADLRESDFIANNHPDEIRYNIFQSLQYLTDWLSGNGCVALPAQIEGVPVRVMDDLATAERSRWEVWHEIHHKRFSLEDFLTIAAEEYLFIRKDLSDSKKIVQVKWSARTEKWYPVAMRLMIQLMTNPRPVEFATELLLPFTNTQVRASIDPWCEIQTFDSLKFKLSPYIEKFNFYFSICANQLFAKTLATQLSPDLQLAENIVKKLDVKEVIKAAYFHGDIGESKQTLDPLARREQRMVHLGDEALLLNIKELSQKYLAKFGVKFLISAQDKTALYILNELTLRIQNSSAKELNNAREALWQISNKRLTGAHQDLREKIVLFMKKHEVLGVQICISTDANSTQSINLGEAVRAEKRVSTQTYFELASLSKTLASCFAIEYFGKLKVSLNTSVNSLFEMTESSFRVTTLVKEHPEWADQVTLKHLLEHTALNLHYVNGFPLKNEMPNVLRLLDHDNCFGYAKIGVINPPGTIFQYSGGGFLVLEHLIESLEKKSIVELTESFLKKLGALDLCFDQSAPGQTCASGYLDGGIEVTDSRKMFPAFAAGAMGTAKSFAQFLSHLTTAFHSTEASGPISHSTAVEMLHGLDKSSGKFMKAHMGLGVFTIEAGANRFALHQGANDGFRCLFVHCYDGPDLGKGFVILCNADSNGVLFICDVAQLICKEMSFKGVLVENFAQQFDAKNIVQEEFVNHAYKSMVFDAFETDLPERIEGRIRIDKLLNLSLAKNAEILEVTNQKFARAENLFSEYEPVYDPELYGKQGKIMDSWESVRHNLKTSDCIIFKLWAPATIKFILVSTQYHLGNQAPFISLEGYDSATNTWQTILEKTKLQGHSVKYFSTENQNLTSQIYRISQIPDGGLTRLGLFEELPAAEMQNFTARNCSQSHLFDEAIPKLLKPLMPKYLVIDGTIERNFKRLAVGEEFNIASLAYGASIVSASNEHYGPAAQIISPYLPINMFDGFESARSREPNHNEEIVISLGKTHRIHRIEFDFGFFKNNNPREISIQGFAQNKWTNLLDRENVKAYAGNIFSKDIDSIKNFSQLKLLIYPDGGFNRFRAFSKRRD